MWPVTVSEQVFANMVDTLLIPAVTIDTSTAYGRLKKLATRISKEVLLDYRERAVSYEQMGEELNITSYQVYELLKYYGIVGNIKKKRREAKQCKRNSLSK